jgi:hypothetical protein
MRSLAAPLMHALISSPRQSLGCGIFNLFFRDRKAHKQPTVRRAAAASCLRAPESCLRAPESCFAVPRPNIILQHGIERNLFSTIKLHDAQFLRDSSTRSEGVGVLKRPRPIAVMAVGSRLLIDSPLTGRVLSRHRSIVVAKLRDEAFDCRTQGSILQREYCKRPRTNRTSRLS